MTVQATTQAPRARLRDVRERVTRAERSAGRAAGSVRLLLASKTVPAGVVRDALVADARDRGPLAPVLLGENRVQELRREGPELTDLAPVWHVIGPLQSNKVNAALRWASCVESVASTDLAQRLSQRARDRAVPLDVMVQVNVSDEPTKHGVRPDEARDLAVHVADLPGLRLTGFMTIGARIGDRAVVAAGFDLLRAVRDDVVACGAPGTGEARQPSMGMSGDLEVAVACGATIVRLGTAVFGSR